MIRVRILRHWMVTISLGALGCFAGPHHSAESSTPGSSLRESTDSTTLVVRAQRRAYRGAPPVVPHEPFGSPCATCHDRRGVAVEGVGFAPASPHDQTAGMSAARCAQCHVFQQADQDWKANHFVGLETARRTAERQHALAPPVSPHAFFLREDCLACHDGAASRAEIQTSHPERLSCRQCHLAPASPAILKR